MIIEGIVMNKDSSPIAGVSVYLKSEKTKVAVTDVNGFFKLNGKQGEQVLLFSHLGYELLESNVITIASESGRQFFEIYLEDKKVVLKEVFIISAKPPSTERTIENIKKEHRLIAGGVSIAVMQPEVQRLETLKDALKYEPGVIIQEFFGANDQPRLSIRGSGIQSNPQRRGIYLLQDGIPVNFADGSFIIGVMDPSISESVEVLKGANALRYGTATLGGAINFNSRTGKHNTGTQLKIEAGSYGYGSLLASTGTNWGKTDMFFSASASRQDGFRQHNQNRKLSLSTNLGYRVSKNIDNRTYFNYSYIYFDVPGPLTLEMLNEDPTQVNKGVNIPHYMGPNIPRDKPSREATVVRVANRTVFRLSSKAEVTLSAYYQNIADRFVFPIVLSTQRSFGHDYGITLQTIYRLTKGTLTSGFSGSLGNIDRRGHINKDGLDSYMFSKDKLSALNLTFYAQYHYPFSNRFHFIGNIQAAHNQRNSEDVFPNPELRPWYSHSSHRYRYFFSQPISKDQSFRAINPRIGAIYNGGSKKDFQFFANASTSYEPPTFDELVGTGVTDNINTSPKKLFAIELKKQSAVTAELGSRYEGSQYSWNLSFYRSWIKNELLEVKDFVLGVKETQNYPHTIHQGIEFGFVAAPFKRLFSKTRNNQLVLKAMYTYSDFHFSAGPYKGKKLAGVPAHYITASLEYRFAGKVFAVLNVESQPQKTAIDHSNTLFQHSFSIYGFRVGVEKWKNLSLYLECKNMFNKVYASSYIISDQILLPPMPFPRFTVNNLAFFMPGQMRAFYAGLSYTLPPIKYSALRKSIQQNKIVK